MFEIISDSVERTLSIGKLIAGKLGRGDIVCLFGDLGSGKTVLAKGISRGLGFDEHLVSSPTFVIIREYKARLPIYHFDLYRLARPEDILDLGYEEYFFGEGVSVVEWADRLGKFLPEGFLKIELSVAGDKKRKLKISSRGGKYKKILESIRENISR